MLNNIYNNLNLDDKNIDHLPNNLLSRLGFLEGISLYHNRLQELPNDLWTIKSLRQLNVSANNLTSLSEQVECLENLETLDMNQNKLFSLPDNLHKLPLTNYLYMADCVFRP